MAITKKIPISISVIGHRDALVTEQDKRKIKDIFKQLLQKYPHSPLVLFSQLATGADSLVSQLFLEVKQEATRDMRLIGVLPYNKEYYEKFQFSTEAELEQFHSLLHQVERSFTLNTFNDKVKQLINENSKTHLSEINEYYRKGGEFIADHSIILLALWDGIENNAKGGTANTIFYKQHGYYKNFASEHIFDKEGKLVIIPVQRGKSAKSPPNDVAYTLKDVLKDKSISKALEKIEELNKESGSCDKDEIKKNENYLFPDGKNISKTSSFIRTYFAVADTLANKYKDKYLSILIVLFITGFSTYVFFEIYKHLGLNTLFFGLTIGLIVFAYAMYKISLQSKNHQKFIENRVLSEALRTQFYWHISGINKLVSKDILRLHKKEYAWLNHILSGIFAYVYIANPITINKDNILTHWIIDQSSFFEREIKEIEKKEKLFSLFSKITFAFGIVFLVIIFLLHSKDKHHLWLHPLIVVDSVLFGIFALIKAYYEKRGYKQIRTQYELMNDIFSVVKSKLSGIQDDTSFKNLLEITGKEVLIENGNWFMIYKDKKPEIEAPG